MHGGLYQLTDHSIQGDCFLFCFVLFINLLTVFFFRLYPVAFENARILSEEIAIQGYCIPPEVSQMTAELPNMLRVLWQCTCGVLPSSYEFARV